MEIQSIFTMFKEKLKTSAKGFGEAKSISYIQVFVWFEQLIKSYEKRKNKGYEKTS